VAFRQLITLSAAKSESVASAKKIEKNGPIKAITIL